MSERPPIISLENGRYTITSQLGAGGIATVWGVFDNRLETEKAMKVLTLQSSSGLLQELSGNESVDVKRFKSEAKIMSAFNHPNIVTVQDCFSDGTSMYIVMEKCLGSLDTWVALNGAMPVNLAVAVMIQVLRGLEYAHRHEIVHRDIKPHNILIADSGTIKLGDFGLAHDTYASNVLTKTNALMGSIQFMSPEQRTDAKRVDHRTDLYSVAMTLVWLIEGQTVGDIYVPEVLSDLRSRYPSNLIDIVEKAGHRSPDNRYHNATEMRQALEGLPLSCSDVEQQLFGIQIAETSIGDLYNSRSELTSILDSTTSVESVKEATQTAPLSATALNRLNALMGGVVLLLLGIGGLLLFDKQESKQVSPSLEGSTENSTATASPNATLTKTFKRCSTFIETTQSSLQVGPREAYSMSMGDFNRDGLQDAAFSNLMDKSISLYYGDGQKMIDAIEPIEIPTLRLATQPLFGDLDNDGRMDIVGLHHDASRITIHKGLKDGNFRGLDVYGRDEMLQEPAPLTGSLVDINDDGWLDLLFVTGTPSGKIHLMSRRNAKKGLDFEILNLPNTPEEPLEWHNILATFDHPLYLDPKEPRIHWIQDGTLYQQDILKTGMLGLKTEVATNLPPSSIFQVLDTPQGLNWIIKTQEGPLLLVQINQSPCTLMDGLDSVFPYSNRGRASFGYWNADNKLDFVTSSSCTYCTSNHILHITQ